MHDVPYVQAKKLGPEIVATLAKVAVEMRRIMPTYFPCGLQVIKFQSIVLYV